MERAVGFKFKVSKAVEQVEQDDSGLNIFFSARLVMLNIIFMLMKL